MNLDFSSELLPLRDRAPAYEDALRRFFRSFGAEIDVSVAANESDRLAASIERVRIGCLSANIHRSNARHALRCPAPRSPNRGMDLYLLCQGNLSFVTPHGTTTLESGDMMFLQADGAFDAYSERFEMISLGVPEQVATHRARGRNWAIGEVIPGNHGIAACLRALLQSAAAHHLEISAEQGVSLQCSILDTVLQVGAASGCTQAIELSDHQRRQLARVKSLATRFLEMPDLCASSVARRASISTRTLHRLFNGAGETFGSWLQRQRLERCRMHLTDPARRGDTVAVVAFSAGFNDLTTFNRAFKSYYGITPRRVREGG